MTENQPCTFCQKNLALQEKHCPQCGYPQGGNAVEKKRFYSKINDWKADFENVAIDVRRFFAIQEGVLVVMVLFFIASLISTYLYGKFWLGLSVIFLCLGYTFWRLARLRVKERLTVIQALRYTGAVWIGTAVFSAVCFAVLFWVAKEDSRLLYFLIDVWPFFIPLSFSVFMAYYGWINARRLKEVEPKQRILELNDAVWSKVERNLEKREENYERIDSFMDK